MRRRDMLIGLVVGGLWWHIPRVPPASATSSPIKPIDRSDDEWRTLLTPEQFRILRQHGTEPKFSSALNNETRQGDYRCAGCDLGLFTSEMKYESGTGWPSFFTVISGRVKTKRDYTIFFMPRTEYHCARCEGHQGHVFDDGPAPTGLRYCNNGLALRFVPS